MKTCCVAWRTLCFCLLGWCTRHCCYWPSLLSSPCSTLYVKVIKHILWWFYPGNQPPTFPACRSSVGFVWGVNSRTAVLTSLPSVFFISISLFPSLPFLHSSLFLSSHVGQLSLSVMLRFSIPACYIKGAILIMAIVFYFSLKISCNDSQGFTLVCFDWKPELNYDFAPSVRPWTDRQCHGFYSTFDIGLQCF